MMPKPPTARPKLRRLGSHKIVTIGAGVVATDGIVLAADSQETLDDYLKLFKPKVIELPTGSSDLKCVIVGSGDGPFIDQITEKITSLLSVIDPYLENAKETVQQAITDVCHQVFPFYAEGSRPQAHLLIGIRASDGLGLFDSVVPMLKNADPCTFIGFGRDLAAYKAKQLMHPQISTAIAAPLTAYILDIVKKNVERCGGETKMIVMTQEGSVEEKSGAFLRNAEAGYDNAAWFIESLLFPILPVMSTKDGRDTLSVIADLGKSDTGKREEMVKAIVRTLGIPKLLRKPPSASEELTSAAIICAFSLTLIGDSVLPSLARAGAISDEQREYYGKIVHAASMTAQVAMRLAQEGRIEDAKKFLAANTKLVGGIVSRLPSVAQKLEDQP
jgi:hypothetical protein